MPDVTSSTMALGLVALIAYLVGSIPFGVVISQAFGLQDPRETGSKSIGATNVLRSGSKLAAFLTLLLDGAKGGIAVLIARAAIGEDAAQLAGLSAFVGHLYPIWLGFKGGKGVATAFGTLLGLAPFLGLAAGAIWLIGFAAFRISSLSALLTTVLSPLVAIALGLSHMTALLIVLAALIWWRHRANIARLLNGTEPKVGQKSKESET